MATKTSSSRPAGNSVGAATRGPRWTRDRQPVRATPAVLDDVEIDLELARSFPAVPMARTDDGVTLPAPGAVDEEQTEVAEARLGPMTHAVLSNRSELDQWVQQVRSETVSEVAPPSHEALPDESARTGVARSRTTALIATLLAFIVCAAIWPPPAAIILVGTGSLCLLVAIRRARRPRTDPRHRRQTGSRHREPGVAFLESYLRNAGRPVDVRPVASPGEPAEGTTSV